MNKQEFLGELKNNLEGRISVGDVKEILGDYGDIFDAGLAEGKSPENVSLEIGSPAKIARNILEDGAERGSHGIRQVGSEIGDKLNRGIDTIYDKATAVSERVDIDRLAGMGRRVGAYLIDAAALGLLAVILFVTLDAGIGLFLSTSSYETEFIHTSTGGTMLTLMPLIIFALWFGMFNAIGTFFVWGTNGYTPGKWLLKIRVEMINGRKIGFWDALFREFVLKMVANAVLSGFLNLFSLVWGCATKDHKTAHDLLAKTAVVNTR